MSASIESLGYPLLYKSGQQQPDVSHEGSTRQSFRSKFRALEGMQKEALITNRQTGDTWRMVCDEGAYLNGTDLSAFPLGFFAAAVAFSFTKELFRHAHDAGVTFANYTLQQATYYTMEGSALRGNMVGGSLPAEIAIKADSSASADVVQELIVLAQKTCPVQACMEQALQNTFALYHNGKRISAGDVLVSEADDLVDPSEEILVAKPETATLSLTNALEKLACTKPLHTEPKTVGSSFSEEQKRMLHIETVCTVTNSQIIEAKIQAIKPNGSLFCFRSDLSEQGRAPSALAYLSAGVGFCYMTQIGRYVAIAKKNLSAYSVILDTDFIVGDGKAHVEPVDTHTFLTTEEDEATAQKIQFMSEQTCFLHASLRQENVSAITIET